MALRKLRGRPKNASRPEVASADRSIALTVHRLALWGFSMRGRAGILQIVGEEARDTLRRTDHAGFALSAERVKQVFDAWRREERDRRSWKAKNPTYEMALPERKQFTSASLRRQRPRQGWGLRRYAKKLLANGGQWRFAKWPTDRPIPQKLRLELTPQAEKDLLKMPRIVRSKRGR